MSAGKIEQIIGQIVSASKTNDKINIIKEHAGDSAFREILAATYDYKRMYFVRNGLGGVTGKEGGADIAASWEQFKEILVNLSSRELSGHAAIRRLLAFLSECAPQTVTIYKNILNKDLRCNIGPKTINKAIPNTVPVYAVQLADKYDPEKDYKVDVWHATPKLDGYRATYRADADALLSRQGHEIVVHPDLLAECKRISGTYGVKIIDGELLVDGRFNESSSIISKHDANGKDRIRFHVFYMDKYDEFVDRQFYSNEPLVLVIPFEVPNSPEKIIDACKAMVDDGYEGLMLRNPETPYNEKRGKELLKVKPVMEDDFVVVGIEEGKGRNTGKLGALCVERETADGIIRCNVGSGYTDEQRENIWNHWQTGEEFTGRIVEVAYQEISKSKNGNDMSLRFPVFVNWKEDRSHVS